MARTYRQQHLAVMAQNERDMRALFSDLHTTLTGVLTRSAGPDGTIPRRNAANVRAEAGRLVTAMFLVEHQGDRKAYTETLDGTVIPLSPYMRILWRNAEQATRIAVDEHAAIMRRKLAKAPDVIGALERAIGNPFTTARAMVQEQAGFKPNALAQYDPLHLFVDARGYRLSDRIWQTSTNTRRKLDLFMDEGIRQGRGALSMSRDLEAFLLPGRTLRITRKPYGTTASFDAMRLARTEITAAAGRAGLMSAAMNPFVNGADWVLSPAHGCCDICDDLAAGSPYTLEELPDLPGASHPQCMCHIRWHTITDAAIVDELSAQLAIPSVRRQTEQLLIDLAGPLALAYFTRLLMGWAGYGVEVSAA